LVDPIGLLGGEVVLGLGAAAFAEAAVVVGSGTVVAAVGVGTYFGTSALIEDTWLGQGGLGELIYDIIHLRDQKTVETIGIPDRRSPVDFNPDPGSKFKMCLNLCRGAFPCAPAKRWTCYALCAGDAFIQMIGGMFGR